MPTASCWRFSKIRERRGEKLRVLKLRHRTCVRVIHRRAGVDQQVTLRVRVGAIFLDEVTIGAPEQTPVEIAQIVAGIVLPILGELGRETREWRTMQARHETLDHRTREQLKRTDARRATRDREIWCGRWCHVSRLTGFTRFDLQDYPVNPEKSCKSCLQLPSCL